ncbi:uncharacterized protein LOC108341410 [Vigna angularis]|uniref:uncharacterized protein LOC108341410 n=1 Tax=Phaseolus angularis TaxID=3914 RepID=UPI000809A731|nr:uncharacterized protein LOC108341410 [Vigna angularis]
MRLNPAKCTFGVTAGKFLGFMLTARGIEANPDKCAAVLDMRSPVSLKEIQRLVGRLTSLSRFIPKLPERIQLIVKRMKKGASVEGWDAKCKQAFLEVKGVLTNPLVMNKPWPGEELQIYLGVSPTAISAALVQEKPEPRLIYFINRVLQDAETRYQQVEMVVLALLNAARRLCPYFQSHQVVIRTDHPISKILRKPDMAGWMVSWAVELSQFGLRFEPRGPVRGQHLTDFAVELPQTPDLGEWNLYVDGASGRARGGAGIVLEGPDDFLLEHSLVFKFKASNNKAKYEALIAGLALANDMGAHRLTYRKDSQLVVRQMKDEFQMKDEHLLKYFHKARNLLEKVEKVDIKHIPREENVRVNMLSKLSSGKEKGHLTTLFRQVLSKPSVECLVIDTGNGEDWRSEIRKLMQDQDNGHPVQPADARKISRYVIIGDDLYNRGFSTPLLKCLARPEAQYMLDELHNGICGFHTGRRVLKARTVRAGYYWPTMEEEARDFVWKCRKCQAHANIL